MNQNIDRYAAYVDDAARVLDLPLAAAHRDGVIRQFTGIALLAQLVTEFPLAEDQEPAALMRPGLPE